MSNVGEGVYTFEATWLTSGLDNVCPICAELNGKTWRLDDLSGILSDPVAGDIWDLDVDESLVHPNCNCFLHFEVFVELENTELYLELKQNLEEWHYMPSNIAEAKQSVADLNGKIELSYVQFRMFQRILQRTLHLMKMAGLPPETEQAISRITRLIWSIRMLTVSIHALEAATGPIGWANALLGAITGGVILGESVGGGGFNPSSNIIEVFSR